MVVHVRSPEWVGRPANFVVALEENLFPGLLQFLEVAHIPWLVALPPSSELAAHHLQISLSLCELCFCHHNCSLTLSLLLPPCKDPCDDIRTIQMI